MSFRRIILIMLGLIFIWGSPQAGQTKARKVRLGPEINTPTREVHPLVSADGKTLYFTREWYVDDDLRSLFTPKIDIKELERAKEVIRQQKDLDEPTKAKLLESLNIPPLDETRLRAFTHQTSWYSEKLPDGRFSKAKKMPPPINNFFPASISSVLPDGNTLLAYGTFYPNANDPMSLFKNVANEAAKYKDGDFLALLNEAKDRGGRAVSKDKLVAMTVRTGDGWSEPEYLKTPGVVNHDTRISIFLAPGNRVLIYSLTNEESFGQADLFVSFLQPDGIFSKPKNMGTAINTKADEITPIMAPDGITLYFASDRKDGLGGFDIYMSRRLDDSWLKWSPAVNLGPEVNSPLDESNLCTDATGNYAFLAEGEREKEDIYMFALPQEARPYPVAFIRGRTHDPAGKSVPARITYERLRDGVGAGGANANQTTGRYQMILPISEDYGFRAEASGYIAVSEKIDLTKAKPGQEFERDLLLIPIKVGAAIRLNNVFFEFAKSVLLPESKVELDRLTSILNQYPKMEIEIAGHTDAVGDEPSNITLSENRAAAVRKYLLDHGVAASRLQSRGYGKSRPVATNDTDEGRQLNRRVEFMIVKM